MCSNQIAETNRTKTQTIPKLPDHTIRSDQASACIKDKTRNLPALGTPPTKIIKNYKTKNAICVMFRLWCLRVSS